MAKSAAILPLRFASLAENQQPPGSPGRSQEEKLPLWLAIVFPKLLLEVFVDKHLQQPAIVIKDVKGQPLVYSATVAAEKLGINNGMTQGAAYALCPDVKVHNYDAHVENHRLEELARWAAQFTSKLSVQAPNALLLEVRGSLKFFGGLKKLLTRIKQDLIQRRQYQFCLAVAPTAEAGLLLARSGKATVVASKVKLRSALGDLPVRLLPVDEKQLKQLYNIGVRVLRDLWRLPKDGLSRRFGVELVRYLDAALGYLPDVRQEFTLPDSFAARREWPFEVSDISLITLIAKELLGEMTGFLQSRDACISQCTFVFLYAQLPSEKVTIGMRQPSRDASHLLMLLKERLERFTLQAPIIGMELSAADLQAYSTHSDALFFSPHDQRSGGLSHVSADMLLERLQSRLGRDRVKNVCVKPDHRPECAHSFVGKAVKQGAALTHYRPLWLLPNPRLLQRHKGKLWYQGPLSLQQGPERIESGWWSGRDMCRDYYIAVDCKGGQLWVFKDLKANNKWFLHGLFA